MTEAIPIFKRALVIKLYDKVFSNLSLYVNDNISAHLCSKDYTDEIKKVESVIFDKDVLLTLNDVGHKQDDAKNALIVFGALKNLTPYLAADGRIWVALTHLYANKFVYRRWVAKAKHEKDQIKSIKTHHFVQPSDRGLHRDNALSSLWWWAYICKRYNDEDLTTTLNLLLTHTDLRASILERPSLSRPANVFNAILKCVFEAQKQSMKGFFNRSGGYRRWLREINFHGGTKIYSGTDDNILFDFFWDLLVKSKKHSQQN